MFNHILVPTDGSKISNEAAQAAVRLAKALGAKVTAFYAAPPDTPAGFQSMDEREQVTRQSARACLGVVEKAANAAGVPCETVSATSDYPADAIVAAAKKRRCDLVFMASHGRRFLRRDSLLGRETQRVLEASPVPVLVYRR
ncbi:MAG TPA: universal stress protein [Burkholderiales bacterium]|nr:universal stress protein [Burkholderiales bacterium]